MDGVDRDAQAAELSGAWPKALNLVQLAGLTPKPPEFIVPVWLPVGYSVLFAGHGGSGKSIIALTLAVCIAAGIKFFGLPVQHKRVVYLSCEDGEEVLHWRLSRICAHLGIKLADLDEWLQVIDLVGKDAILWERDPRTRAALTSAYGELDAAMSWTDSGAGEEPKTIRAEVLFVDGIADTYGGMSASSTEINRFVNSLIALILRKTGAVVLIGHVNRPTAANPNTPEGYGGPAAWHNAVRSRWYLRPEDDGDESSTGRMVLELQKSNHGACDGEIRFAWDADAHLFVGEVVESESKFDKQHRDRTEQAAILRAFKGCAADQIIVPAAMQGPRTAYHVLSSRPEMPESMRSGKPAVRRFWRQIEALRQIRAIEETEYRRVNRHTAAQLVLTPEGLRQCV